MSAEAVTVPIRDEPDVTRAILEAARLADAIGMRADQRSRVTTAVSELARNIVKYAKAGRIALRIVGTDPARGVEVCSQDEGPGIPDIDRALEDHYSSGGTLGLGLPGVRRLMDDFEIESQPGAGTRVTAALWK